MDTVLPSPLDGAIDVAIMTEPKPRNERLDLRPLFEERMVIAFPPGHRFQDMKCVAVEAINGESYLSRANCEQRDLLNEICEARHVNVETVYRSEREDWIQTMIMAGMGIAFMPEGIAILAGLMTRVVEPEVIRTVHLASVAGRRFSSAVAAFVSAVERFKWPGLSPLPE
jgi:DNA-binding transcriptional LysR family regulator